MSFTHNHPLNSAHTLSFRDVHEETKQAFSHLFDMGHSAASARHAHEQKKIIEEAEKQTQLADRAKDPLTQDVCHLYQKWRESNYGKDASSW